MFPHERTSRVVENEAKVPLSNSDDDDETSSRFWSEPTEAAFSLTNDDFTSTLTNSLSKSSASFPKLLRKQVYRVVGFIVTEQINHEMFAKNLLREIVVLRTMDEEEEDTEQAVALLLQKVSCLADSYKSLEHYATNMTNAIAKMAERASPSEPSSGHQNKELRAPALALLKCEMEGSNKSSAFIVVLSDIYEIIRATKIAADAKAQLQDNKRTSSNKMWVAPATFERKTFKYWIECGRMTDVLLAAAREAPLLVYGASGRLTKDEDLYRSEGDKLWNSLASSNSSVYFESKGMSLYKERILRRERSQLFRIRWYGDLKPDGNDIVFLELKTHHAKWVNESSIKQRVSIREKDVKAFLSRTDNLGIQDAKRMIHSTCPKLHGKELEKSADLLLAMHRLVKEHDLHPCIRTRYQRVAFQSSENNKLRLTVDRNILLIDESSTPQDSWCLPDAAVHHNIMKRMPFDVLEVKLTDGREMPASIESLLQDGIIIEAAKFSKYLTGAAAFNATNVCSLPYWTKHKAFALLFESTDSSNTQEKHVSFACNPWHPSRDDVEREDTESMSDDVAESDRARRKNPENAGGRFSFGIAATNFLTLGEIRRNGNRKKLPSIAPERAARVEPKSFFANERTFIQWISGAILLFTIALIMLENGTIQFQRVGFALLASSTVIVAYSMFVYKRRIRLLSRGEPYGYVDHCAPIFLGCAVFFGLFAIIVILLKNHVEENKQASISYGIQPKPNVCVQHEVTGLSRLEYQPSDILVLGFDDRLMVASLETILVLHSTGRTETLITIPGADLEGLTSVGRRIFAVSEVSKKKSELIELRWDSAMDHVEYIQRWEISTPNAEGIAFVNIPGDPVGNGKLYIAGDLVEEVGENVANRGIIDVYEIPSETSPSSLKGHCLNSNLINEGLADSKISALQFFEGVLYVLHDNAKVVRSWDLNEGKLLSEWNLPQFSKQWEGMALHRRPPAQGPQKDGQQLRSGIADSGELFLHLALDSPPEVWTLAVEEDEATNGQIILPDCAMSHAMYEEFQEKQKQQKERASRL